MREESHHQAKFARRRASALNNSEGEYSSSVCSNGRELIGVYPEWNPEGKEYRQCDNKLGTRVLRGYISRDSRETCRWAIALQSRNL